MKRTQKGITLVALVITIIILLILAGITISSLTQTSLFTKANEAKEKTEDAKLRENTILNEFAEGIDEKVGSSEGTTYTAYTRGQTVTVENKDGVEQSFYVLNDSSSSEATVTLLAAKNINTSTLLQGDDANIIAFSANTGWAEGENLNDYGNLKTDGSSAVYYAVQYGGKFEGATGRLMIVGEVKNITGLTSYGTIGSPDWIKTTNYWLGSARDAGRVWVVGGGRLSYSSYGSDSYYGVRPVIEISKSEI